MSNLPDRPAPRRPRHLMDPANPVRPVNNASLTHVQQWVQSVLVVTVAYLLAAGWVVIAGTIVEKDAGQWVLLGNSFAFGAAGVAAALVIHKHKPVSGWLVLGAIPAVLGAVWIFG